jgi:hypothetical protein
MDDSDDEYPFDHDLGADDVDDEWLRGYEHKEYDSDLDYWYTSGQLSDDCEWMDAAYYQPPEHDSDDEPPHQEDTEDEEDDDEFSRWFNSKEPPPPENTPPAGVVDSAPMS